MRDNKAIGTMAALVALGSSGALVFVLSGGFGPRLDPVPHQAAGRVLAQQTLSLLKPGGLVTIITRDTTTFQNPATDVLLASLRKQLTKAGVKIDSIQALEVDPLRPVAVPAGDFFQWIKNSTKGSVIVSLMGPPMLNEAQLVQLGEVKPAIVAFCSGPARDQVDLRSLFSRGLLHAAVVSRRDVAAQNGSLNEQQAFERQFIAVTPSNLAALSTASNPVP
jgi:hypothetical protein